MRKKNNAEILMLVLAGFCLFLVSGCALRPGPISKHDFGDVYVGTTADSPQVSWTNVGKKPLEVVGLLVFPLGGPFNLKTSQPFQSFILQSGASSKNFTFSFTPTQVGPVSGDAVPQIIGSKAKVQGLRLSGNGVYQIIAGAMTIGGGDMKVGDYLDFGSVIFPGGLPSQRKFNLINMTNKPIVVNADWTKGTQGFSVLKPSLPITVPALGKVKVTLRFAPPGIGTFTDGVTFVDRANPQNKSGTVLRGKGIRGG